MIRIISKNSIIKYILPYLSKPKRGGTNSNLWEIINAILYKFKTGIQWSLLPVKSLIYNSKIKYGAVYHHFRKWVLDGSWEKAFQNILTKYRCHLDLSVANFDGTHSPAKKGGKQVAYQGRKKCKTSNTLWLVDKQGLPVGFTPPIAGNHHDVFQSKCYLKELNKQLLKSNISLDGLFVNADAGFDSSEFRIACDRLNVNINMPINSRHSNCLSECYQYFDERLYKERYVVERTNAWMDSKRTLMIRYDTSVQSWTAWHYIFCINQWINYLLKL